MTFPVRWFFWLPCAVFGFLTAAFGASAGNALADGDYARAMVVFSVTALCASASFGCGVVAHGETL